MYCVYELYASRGDRDNILCVGKHLIILFRFNQWTISSKIGRYYVNIFKRSHEAQTPIYCTLKTFQRIHF